MGSVGFPLFSATDLSVSRYSSQHPSSAKRDPDAQDASRNHRCYGDTFAGSKYDKHMVLIHQLVGNIAKKWVGFTSVNSLPVRMSLSWFLSYLQKRRLIKMSSLPMNTPRRFTLSIFALLFLFRVTCSSFNAKNAQRLREVAKRNGRSSLYLVVTSGSHNQLRYFTTVLTGEKPDREKTRDSIIDLHSCVYYCVILWVTKFRFRCTRRLAMRSPVDRSCEKNRRMDTVCQLSDSFFIGAGSFFFVVVKQAWSWTLATNDAKMQSRFQRLANLFCVQGDRLLSSHVSLF